MARIGRIAKVKTNFPGADFWLQKKGSARNVGKVRKEFRAQDVGIKVTSPLVLPEYLAYLLEYVHRMGGWLAYAYGTLNLKHLRVEDIKRKKL